jgi:hypothetical protein
MRAGILGRENCAQAEKRAGVFSTARSSLAVIRYLTILGRQRVAWNAAVVSRRENL